MENVDLGKTRITDKIRVSSAAIYYGNAFFGSYYQLETFIFSDDERQKSRQIIHYTTSSVTENDKERIAIIHTRISNGLLAKFQPNILQP